MRTKKELDELSDAIGTAICNYHNAVAANLREAGKEFNVLPDNEDDDGLRLDTRDDDNYVVNLVIDKIRWNPDYAEGIGRIEVHSCEEEYKERDEWFDIDYLGDDTDYVLDNINWED